MRIEEAIRQKNFTDPYEKAVINVIYTANWLRDFQNASLKQHGLLVQHYNTLRIIKGRHPAAVSPGEIKEVMLDKATDVTRLVDKLVQKQLVKRKTPEENRRRVDVQLTAKGLKLLTELEQPIRDLKTSLRKRLTAADAETISELMDKMRG